jgi:RNA polymerase sigma-70 factor (ECF subfamily)
MGTVTRLLRDWSDGSQAALDELIPLVYGELRRLAGGYLRGERPGQTLRPTDLVSEAYLRLVDGAPLDWGGRAHFFAIAARAMRQVLVDSARQRSAGKRGGGERPATLDEVGAAACDRPEGLVALDDALSELAKNDERKAKVVELFYFGGLSQGEIAAMLAVHVNTVSRDLRFAEAWLKAQLGGGST